VRTKGRTYQRITLRFGRTASRSRKGRPGGGGIPGGARRRRRWRSRAAAAATAGPVVVRRWKKTIRGFGVAVMEGEKAGRFWSYSNRTTWFRPF
jgi:hypothetical protein